jgi:pimeloyl-ACP methyl ester carboxylesterase
VPVWFGPEESPLFGVLHVPDGPTRGVIVLCPPLGLEYSNSYSTFIQLATCLTQLGFAALRFDYRSTGDSFDRTADDSGERGFATDVGLAVDFARTTGIAHVGIVGMRLGANLICVQCALEPVEAVVLWDPCPTGRSFLREQRALGAFAGAYGAEERADALDLPRFKLSPGMWEEISGLDLVAGPPCSVEAGRLADKVLLLTRSERIADRNLAGRFDPTRVEHREVAGQPELLDVRSPDQTVPADGLETVAGWLDKVMPPGVRRIATPTSREVVVRISTDGPDSKVAPGGRTTLVRERAVRLGPAELFGIETERDSGGSGPACIFVSVANDHRIGPGRLWVQLSRRLAADGFRCVRIDVNGFGDSPARDGGPVNGVHSIFAVDDVLDTARAMSPDDPRDVLLFGLCSSGYHILEAALTLSPRGICLVNPWLVFQPPEMTSGGKMDARRRFCLPPNPLVTAARAQPPIAWLRKRFPTLLSSLHRAVQTVAWRLRGVAGPRQNRPGERLGDLVEDGTDVLLICGPQEISPFSETGLKPARRGGPEERLQIEVIPELDHGLYPSRDREGVTELILDFVLTRFRLPPEG